ncbi:type A2 lantipeptide [Streptomyces sp. NPDC002004]
MSSTPWIATQEVSDSDLDSVSGGLGGGLGGSISGDVDGLVPAGFALSTQGGGGVDTSGLTGLASGLPGLVPNPLGA